MSAEPFDTRACALGEGPLWHPLRKQLFWFDILGKKMLSNGAAGPEDWQFDEHVSAAGWVDEGRLLIASETALFTFDLSSGTRTHIIDLEAADGTTRSNDGRADPQGGFWIGTMDKAAKPGGGAIYRFYQGELRLLFDAISIPNAICFAPSGTRAYFADTATGRIQTVQLDPDGWPDGPSRTFVHVTGDGSPDGAVCDAAGNLWNAQWGAGRVAVHAPDGRFLQSFEVPGIHTSCPAFGGADLCDLYVTTAQEGIEPATLAPGDGQTFRIPGAGQGQAEHRVLL